MTQPSPNPEPPFGGPPPPAGGFAPPSGPAPHGQFVPPQYAPPTYAGLPAYPAPPPGYAPPGWAGPRPGYAPVPLSPGGLPLASFGDRLLAWLIDTALATAVTMVLFVPVILIIWWQAFSELTRTNPDGTLAEPDPDTMITGFLVPMLLAELGLIVVLLGLYWLYHVEYLRRTGQTVGKKVMKIRVVPLDPTRTLDRDMAGKRYLVEFVGGSLLPGLSYLDGLWQLWDKPWQQCLHDKFAGTVVVKVSG